MIFSETRVNSCNFETNRKIFAPYERFLWSIWFLTPKWNYFSTFFNADPFLWRAFGFFRQSGQLATRINWENCGIYFSFPKKAFKNAKIFKKLLKNTKMACLISAIKCLSVISLTFFDILDGVQSGNKITISLWMIFLLI